MAERKTKNRVVVKRMEDSKSIQSMTDSGRRTLFTIKFGALTTWFRDLSLIILIWKVLYALPHIVAQN